MKIDAHQHFWKLSLGVYGWLSPELGILYRDYLPEDLQPILKREGIDKTIAIQAAPAVLETEFLLDLADRSDTIAGVVGWLDMEDDAFEKELERLLERRKFVGIRPMIQDIPDVDWMLRPKVRRNFNVLADHGCCFEFLTRAHHLPNVIRIVSEIPNLRCVIDHLSKPEIKAGRLDPWRQHMTELAKHPNVWCKLSGMVTEADHRNWKAEQLKPYVAHVVESFGYDRVMFGSDWPVCLLAAEYHQVVKALDSTLAGLLDEEQKGAVFGENAARFYKIADSRND